MDLKYVFQFMYLVHRLTCISLDYLLERMWEHLALVKVYTKKRGAHPDLTDPICLRKGASIEVCALVKNVLN